MSICRKIKIKPLGNNEGFKLEYQKLDGSIMSKDVKYNTFHDVVWFDDADSKFPEIRFVNNFCSSLLKADLKNFPTNFNIALNYTVPFSKYKPNIGLVPLDDRYFEDIDFDSINGRREDWGKNMFGAQSFEKIEIPIKGYFVTGIGNESIYEVGIALDSVEGYPYMPGSGFSGALRSYIIRALFESKEELALQNEDFCMIFGTANNTSDDEGIDSEDNDIEENSSGNIGLLTFFDLVPKTAPLLKRGVICAHMGEYYVQEEGANIPPADYFSTNPIKYIFLKDPTFITFIGWSEKLGISSFEDIKIAGETLSDIIQSMLLHQGIGAKTSIGFGYRAFTEEEDYLLFS